MTRESKRMMPASLIVDGRSCMIAGGGNVALRKTNSLLDAGANVTIVAPELCEGLTELAADKQIEHISRTFEENDVKNHAVVFAATDSEETNKSVLDACRSAKVLCCAIDSNWREGDFVSPASFRHQDITVSVSTGGRSCTDARDIKNAIADFVKGMDL